MSADNALTGHRQSVLGLTLDSQGMLYSCSAGCTIRVWSCEVGEPPHVILVEIVHSPLKQIVSNPTILASDTDENAVSTYATWFQCSWRSCCSTNPTGPS